MALVLQTVAVSILEPDMYVVHYITTQTIETPLAQYVVVAQFLGA